MAINPKKVKLILEFAKLAFDIVKGLLDDELSSEAMLANFKSALAKAKNEILDHIQALALADLQGDVDGLMITFDAYDPIPDGGGDPIASEEERLRNLIDDAAQVFGDLKAIITNNFDLDLVFGCVPILAAVVPLRTAAMVERTFTYGINDLKDVPAMLSEVKNILQTLREKSDSRFGPATLAGTGEPGFIMAGYNFKGSFVHVLDIPVDAFGNPTHNDSKFLNKMRASHMDRAYQSIAGVFELNDFKLV